MKRGTDGALGTPEFTKSYTVWDAVAGYAVNDHFDLRLNANNLFDKDYVAAINKSGYRYTPGAPRSLLLTANSASDPLACGERHGAGPLAARRLRIEGSPPCCCTSPTS